MWSAVGQWVGGIGTVITVWIALKQMNETRRLQYELLKPDIDIYTSSNGVLISLNIIQKDLKAVEEWLSEEIKIIISNSKQTPVKISQFSISTSGYYENKTLFSYLNFQFGVIAFLRELKRIIVYGRVIITSHARDECNINKILQPGDEYTIRLNLSSYTEDLVEFGVLFINARVRYTNSQSKSISIVIVDPSIFVVESFISRDFIQNEYFYLIDVIKNEEEARKKFYRIMYGLKKWKKRNQKLYHKKD